MSVGPQFFPEKKFHSNSVAFSLFRENKVKDVSIYLTASGSRAVK